MKNVMKRAIQSVFALMLLIAGMAAFMPRTASAEIRFCILPRLNAVELYTMFEPLAAYLEKETGEKVHLIIPKDFEAFKTAASGGQMEMGFANPLIYIQLKKNAKVEPLALSAEAKAGTRFRGIIIARKDSGIEKIGDLKGKKLVFVEKDSAAGYIFQMLLLSKAGLNLQSDFTTLPFAKKHDNVILAVFNKAGDAGGVREDDLEKMKDKVDLSQIKIVGYTDYFPNWPVFSTHSLNAGLTAKVKSALLKLKPNEPESQKILTAAKLAGFVPVTDKDYDMLRQAAKLAGAL